MVTAIRSVVDDSLVSQREVLQSFVREHSRAGGVSGSSPTYTCTLSCRTSSRVFGGGQQSVLLTILCTTLQPEYPHCCLCRYTCVVIYFIYKAWGGVSHNSAANTRRDVKWTVSPHVRTLLAGFASIDFGHQKTVWNRPMNLRMFPSSRL